MEHIAAEAVKGITGEAVKPLVQRLVDSVLNEARYCCCFNSYIENFEKEKEILAPKLKDVKIEIGKASGVSRVKNEMLHWTNKADNLIQVDTTRKKKWCFGKCPNCIWQYQRGKELADKTMEIQKLMGRCSSKIVAGPADVPNMKYHRLPHFIPFESRQLKFQELMEALQDENCNMIGLHSMGGLGKTSLATELGAKLEEASKFDKVIFLVVSKPPDYKKIQREIAKHLDLKLEEGTEEDHSKKIWSKVTNVKEKLLIILDDVWDAFDLIKVLGISSSDQHKGCSVLITTRIARVCTRMGCQKTIHLEMLPEKEALDLFLAYASVHNSSSLKGVSQNIVKQCGGVPVAIVAVARTLKDCDPIKWKEVLKTLENTRSLVNVNEDLTNVYKCLKLSYDNLKNEKAKELFLICSLYLEDHEIPMDALSRIGIGVGLWGDVDKYSIVRSKVFEAIQELIDSCLLLNAKRECVKMHDLVREVALWLAIKDIQSITDFKMPIKGDFRYLFLKIDEFPDKFDVKKVEILITWLDGSKDLNVPDAFFAKMTRLKVLFLVNDSNSQLYSSPSFLYSLQSLKDIRALSLVALILGDISILQNLLSLESLQLVYCSIIELPREFMRLMKLRVLQIDECKIEMNNPFGVIEGCLQLEELTFIQNEYEKERKDAISPNVSPLALDRYQISFVDLSNVDENYNSISRCFKPGHLRQLISEATFKHLVGKSEFLMLGGYEGTGWKNLIPDIVPQDDGGMNDLNILHLYSWPEIQCIIDTKNHCSNVTAFPNLVELHLEKMNVEVLCQGSLPSSFLVQLKIIKLSDCPLLTSIFQSSTTQSLEQLEELSIINCNALECIITNSSSENETVCDNGDNDRKSYESILPKLKTLKVEGCDKLKIILRVRVAGGLLSLENISICNCQQLEYIFYKFQDEDHVMFPSLKQMELFGVPSLIGIYREPISSSMQRPSSLLSRDKSKEKLPSSDTRAFSWAPICCFLHKSKTTIEETNVATSKARLLEGCTIPISGLHVSKNWFDSAGIFMRQLLSFRHVKKMNFAANLSLNSESLFSLSIASMMLWEELTIRECFGLKAIITGNTHDYNDQIKNIPIFPKLEKLKIVNCRDLEFLILSTVSVGIQNLKSLTIKDAPKLNYVVGKNHHKDHLSNQNQKFAVQFHLPTLEEFDLQDVPKLIIKYFIDLMACSDEGQLSQKTAKEVYRVPPFQVAQSLMTQSLQNIKKMSLWNCSNLISLVTLPVASAISIENLKIHKCDQLKYIVADEGDAQALMNHWSIFPKLKSLQVEDCKELEFLFPSSVSVKLKNLKYLNIEKALELKCVFGKYQHDDHLSTQNQNDELHFYLPSLQEVRLSNCRIKSFTDLMVCSNEELLKWKTTKELYVSINAIPPFQATQVLLIQSFNNIKEMTLDNCSNLISLFTLSTASMILTEILRIYTCQQLKCIVADEGDTPLAHMTHNSFFPKLKVLSVSECGALEYLFPASIFRSLTHLEFFRIFDAPQLKYVFGRSHHEDNLSHENHNIQTYIDFPALKTLRLRNVPNLVRICPTNYYLRGLSLKYIYLKMSPKLRARFFNDFMVCGIAKQEDSTTIKVIEMWPLKTLENLMVWDSKIEVIFSLTDLEAKKRLAPLTSSLQWLKLRDLSELRNIWRGPKNMLSLNSLSYLKIIACKKLEVVFSASTMRNLPKLKELSILDCEELGYIIEEDNEKSVGDHLHHQPCFPNLSRLTIKRCNRLKYLFCITMSSILPKLSNLSIEEAPNLEHILIRRDETEDILAMKDVLPSLWLLKLDNLPSLVNVCQGIDFRTLEKSSKVNNCLNFSFYDGPKNPYLEVDAKTEQELSSNFNMNQSDTEEAKGKQGLKTQQSIINSRNFTKGNIEATKEIVEEDVISKMPKMTNLTSEKKVPIPKHPNIPVLLVQDSTSTTTKFFEEGEQEEEEGGLITTRSHRSGMKAKISLLEKGHETPVHGDPSMLSTPIISSEETCETILPLAPILSKASTSLKQTPLTSPFQSTFERNIQKNVGITYQPSLEAVNTIQVSSQFVELDLPEMMPSFYETNNALSVPGVQEIVNMMKLEGVEPSMLANAFKKHPNLNLSTENRSTELLCFSYRVLLNILNILATKTPFTITEADKNSLGKYLNDASVLGFDKDWLESIKTKVFNCDVFEVHRMQGILKDLGYKLRTYKTKLAIVGDQEAKAAQSVEMAQKELDTAQSHFKIVQQEHANVTVHHSQLSKEYQEVLEQRDQCWKTIATNFSHFGF